MMAPTVDDPDDDLGLVLLGIETRPVEGLRDLFDVRVLDEAGVDLLCGCGLARHPRHASRAFVRVIEDDHPKVYRAEKLRVTISGRHTPGARLEIELTYAPIVRASDLQEH